MSKPGDPGILKCLNLFVIRMSEKLPDGSDDYRGLNLAATLEEAEDWADHLGFEGEILTMEDFEANTPEGRAQAKIRVQAEARAAELRQQEAERVARVELLKSERRRQRGEPDPAPEPEPVQDES